MHNFKKLKIWIKAMDLVTDIYRLTSKYPKSETYNLSSQTQRSAVSIPLNISEGSAKSSNKDFSRFLEYSIGSTMELETSLIIAFNLGYIDQKELDENSSRIIELQKMIYKFKNSLDKSAEE